MWVERGAEVAGVVALGVEGRAGMEATEALLQRQLLGRRVERLRRGGGDVYLRGQRPTEEPERVAVVERQVTRIRRRFRRACQPNEITAGPRSDLPDHDDDEQRGEAC